MAAIWMLSRLLCCLSFLIVTSVCIMTDFATAGPVQEIKEEVKQGVKETKNELQKVPEEFKKAGKELKKKSEDVKKDVMADIEEGKKNVRSLTQY
jgi:F0F1-type ATP synthase membrane subunit b/b'